MRRWRRRGGLTVSSNRSTKAKCTELPRSSPAARNPRVRGEGEVTRTEARGLAPVRERSIETPRVQASSKRAIATSIHLRNGQWHKSVRLSTTTVPAHMATKVTALSGTRCDNLGTIDLFGITRDPRPNPRSTFPRFPA
jgi:hypothetical protein